MTTKPGKVLVVDDDDAGRYVKRHILEQAGHSVTEAHEGFEALRIIVATKPDVVVLDVKLPDIKGTELCRKLRENGVGVCVLMTSAAFVDPADRVASLDSGADAYLIEPFDPNESSPRSAACCAWRAPSIACARPMLRWPRKSPSVRASRRRCDRSRDREGEFGAGGRSALAHAKARGDRPADGRHSA